MNQRGRDCLKFPWERVTFGGDQMAIRRRALPVITVVLFEMHGVAEIDTPAFELRETLTGKYDLADHIQL